MNVFTIFMVMISFFTTFVVSSANAQSFSTLKVGPSTPLNASALLEIQGTTGALLLPRMSTTQKNAIPSPTNGDMIFDTTLGLYSVYLGGSWTILSTGGGAVWGSITGTLSAQTDLQTALNLKAPLASPTFTGTVTAPTFSGALTGNASTATALAAIPSGCSSNQFSNSIAANGNLGCTVVNYNQLSGVLPNPSATTLGGIESAAAVSHQWINSISTSGVPALSQPAFGDLSGSLNLATQVGASLLGVANGGTNLASGTSGGILGYTASGTLASSSLLSQNQLMLGGGAGATPSTLGSLGTTTTLLHGNAAGAPSYGAVNLGTDVTSTLGISNGGTSAGTKTAAFDALSPTTTKGDLIVNNGTNNIRQAVGTNGQALVSDSTQTSGVRWGSVASSGTVNYLSTYNNNPGNGDFELNTTTGFTLGTTGTLTNGIPTGSPTFGSGASGNLSIATVTSGSQLAGTYSLSYVSSAATTAGNMVCSSAFTIDNTNQSSTLYWSLLYKAASGSSNGNWTPTSSNSFGVAFYDVTNSAWLGGSTTGQFSFIQPGGNGQATGTMQTSATGTSYRMCFYNANATAGAITMTVDNFVLSPQNSASSSIVVARASVSSAASTTLNTQINFNNVEYDTTGSVTTGVGAWKFTAPISGFYDVYSSVYYAGTATNFDLYKNGSVHSSMQAGQTTVLAQASTQVQLNTGDTIDLRGNATGTPTAVAPASLAQTNYIIVALRQLTGGGPLGTIVASRAHVGSAASTTSGNPINFDTIDFDYTASITTGATTWQYKCPVSGTYFIATDIYAGAANANLAVYINGSIFGGYITSINGANPGGGSTLVQCTANQTLDIRSPNATFTPSSLTGVSVAQSNHVSIFLLPSLANGAGSATATVASSYYVSSNFTSSTTIPINFDTKLYDYCNCVTTSATAWKFIAPSSGLYTIGGLINPSTAANIGIYKNNVFQLNYAYNNGAYVTNGTVDIRLNAFDFIDIRASASATILGAALATSANSTFITIKRVGN